MNAPPAGQWSLQKTEVSAVMNHVLLALSPGVIAHLYFFGFGTLLNLVLCVAGALVAEALTSGWIGRAWRLSLSDHSALVTAVILALCLPPGAPWWLALTASVIAIVVAKQIFGGCGHNLFNPAMLGLVFALVAFPYEMSLWFVPGPEDVWPGYAWSAEIIKHKFLPPVDFSAVSSATPLAHMRTELHNMMTVQEVYDDPMFGFWGGYAWEWINLGYFIGGLWLLWRKLIDWRAPAAFMLSLCLASTVAYGTDSDIFAPPLFHLLSGGVVLGAFFVITDPCSGCTTPMGKLVFGAGAGLLVFTIRTTGSFPDAVAFSVLLMNSCAPLLDQYLIPRCFAQKQ